MFINNVHLGRSDGSQTTVKEKDPVTDSGTGDIRLELEVGSWEDKVVYTQDIPE